jgi:predicted secreted protein
MAKASSLPLLSQYSDVFTRLHEGKHACMGYGMNRVALNRYIVDNADSTSSSDPANLLSMVDPERIEGDGSLEQKHNHCREQLLELVALQEEINTLQKVAREKGINGGVLNIVGQASIQSPSDHGASVIHQLSALMGGVGDSPSAANSTAEVGAPVTAEPPMVDDAANDEQEPAADDDEPVSQLNQLVQLMREHWRTISFDVVVCFFASLFAIGLVS